AWTVVSSPHPETASYDVSLDDGKRQHTINCGKVPSRAQRRVLEVILHSPLGQVILQFPRSEIAPELVDGLVIPKETR
ncbi:MAG TPA: hypothetical protein VGO93_23450, partial [Candidatus Xenobia bacterium]